MEDVRILDVTTEESKQEYKKNLKKLIKKIKQQGTINKLVTLRNDDFLPQDYTWRINLDGEYKFLASYKKQEKIGILERLLKTKKQEPSEIENFKIICPTKFRSTKHFTINTPLNLTTEYNNVTLDRTFTIIDEIDNFLNSGYGYSLSERDAYLDITHEGLKISEKAVILISLEKYKEIKEDKELMETLSKRKIIIFKGDMSLAINTFLVENEILPFRSKIVEYDDEIKHIIETSLKEICKKYNLKYNVKHGNLNGHFTSLLDQIVNEDNLLPLIKFFNEIFEDNIINLNELKNKGYVYWQEYIDTIGYDAFKNTLKAYNNQQKEILKSKKQEYIEERKNITPEISELFKNTIKLIKENEEKLKLEDNSNEITNNIIYFFKATDIKTQVECAKKIIEKLKEEVKIKG